MIDEQKMAQAAAFRIFAGFVTYHDQFKGLTRRAQSRFELREWQLARLDAVARLDLYRTILQGVVADVRSLLGDYIDDLAMWARLKREYSRLIPERDDCELAETFFNSTTRRVFNTVGVNPTIEYVYMGHHAPLSPLPPYPIYHTYPVHDSVEAALLAIVTNCRFAAPFHDLAEDLRLAAAAIARELPPVQQFEVLKPVFYRGKGAYIIGRIRHAHGTAPLCMSLTNGRNGLAVDAVLLTEDEISIVFSFAHAYFLVDIQSPGDYVGFLNELMPRKSRAELYISLGFNKHGKTEMYRDFILHLEASDDRFVIARGTPGMVMVVFTLPSYELVFKIIKDRFDFPKTATRADVMAKYDFVFKHDRAGRLVDAQEFEHLEFARDRFCPDLLATLLDVAGNSVTVEGDRVAIAHLYTERRITPLNLYLAEADDGAALQAALDYGQAIKDLAAANIFPGDLFLKNFGVTRHGRVIFYDYDELVALDQCRFRRIPPPRNLDDELSPEPWYSVREHDVFPEQFVHFFGLRPELKAPFMAAHGELCDAAFWRNLQTQHRKGVIPHVYPYRATRHLHDTHPIYA